MKPKELSVFFPLYNEEENVAPLVDEALSALPHFAEKFEIILVNDGSTDGTRKVGEELTKKHSEVKIVNQENKGYGGALKTGFSEAKYEWVFFSDGDRQFDLEELENFVETVNSNQNPKLIIGYRKRRAEGLKRQLITWAHKVWNKIFFGFPFAIRDADCAFKLIHREVLDEVGPLVSDGGMISTEFLLKALDKGYKPVQIGVTHKNRQFGSPTGNSGKVIKKAVIETSQLLKEFPNRLEKLKILIFTTLLLTSLFLVSKNINFMQNDDYTHYGMVEQFLQGNFTLDPYLGATFYLQGVLGAVWVYLFGIPSLPVLTLFVSILAFYVFLRILLDFFKLNAKQTILVGSLFLLNPWFLYSIWGFMTENYFMLFFMLSIYFVFLFTKEANWRNFTFANIFIVLSYFVRQFAFVTSLAFAVFLLLRRKWRAGFAQLLLFAGLLIFHYKVFPITPQMYDGGISLLTFFNWERTFSLFVMVGIYLGIFGAPLIFNYFASSALTWRRRLILLVLAAVAFFGIFGFPNNSREEGIFSPKSVIFTVRARDGDTWLDFAKVEFPYLENVFGRKGFLENNLDGNKYHYPGFFDLFNLLDLVGKVGLIMFLVILVNEFTNNFKQFLSFEIIYVFGFVCLLVLAPRVFDRYLLPLIPIFILLLFRIFSSHSPTPVHFSKIQTAVLSGALIFWLILGYQYSADFIKVNQYVWSRATQLSQELNLPKEKFNVNHSWRSLYPVGDRSWEYYFEYAESKRLNSDNFEVVEEHTISYPFNFYKNPKILLFHRLPQEPSQVDN